LQEMVTSNPAFPIQRKKLSRLWKLSIENRSDRAIDE
jgi:hypothetical protein